MSELLPLFDALPSVVEPAARHRRKDPEESIAAAGKVKVRTQWAMILRCLLVEPLTCDGVALSLGFGDQARISSRFSGMEAVGLIERDGKAETRTRSMATRWKITERGRQFLEAPHA